MKSLITRSISGAIYVAIIVAAVLCGTLPFMALIALLTFLGILELSSNIVGKASTFCGWLSTALTAVIGASIVSLSVVNTTPTDQLAFYLLAILSLTIVSLAVFDKSNSALRTAISSLFSLLYIALPIFLLGNIYAGQGLNHISDSKWIVLSIFILIWVNDTGAYCVGCTLGKHRLCERLSPKKSIEGFVGGMAFCIAGAALLGVTLPVEFPMTSWIILGVVVSLFATIGDLFESLIKRTMGVKDSGHLIPGHGGILDRIDSLLFVAPAAYILFMIL